MDPTNIAKIKSYQIIMQKKNFFWNKTYVGCFVSKFDPLLVPNDYSSLFRCRKNEAEILLIRPSLVKKFWTLETPKETGSIGSTPRRVETL